MPGRCALTSYIPTIAPSCHLLDINILFIFFPNYPTIQDSTINHQLVIMSRHFRALPNFPVELQKGIIQEAVRETANPQNRAPVLMYHTSGEIFLPKGPEHGVKFNTTTGMGAQGKAWPIGFWDAGDPYVIRQVTARESIV